MGRVFSFSSAWDRHYAQVQDQGGPERAGDGPEYEAQEIQSPIDGRVRKNRLKIKEGYTTGLREQDVNYKGDRVVIVGEESDRRSGRVIQYVQRYGDDGSSRGTHAVEWERTGRGELTIARTRRVRGV